MSRQNYSECRYCTERYVGCHSECKKYIDARNKSWEEKGKIIAERKKESSYNGYCRASVIRNMRAKKQGK